MTEEHPLDPQSPYAATKLGADRLAYAYYRTYGLPIVIIRPFNNYGPRQYPEKLIPFYITSVLENRPLLVYGTGRNTRDWVFVPDCCQALQNAMEKNIRKLSGQVINIGVGQEASVLEIAGQILEYFGKPFAHRHSEPFAVRHPERSEGSRLGLKGELREESLRSLKGRPKSLLRFVADRPGHVERLISDTSKARKLLNWQATTALNQGIGETIAWYERNPAWWRKIRRRREYQTWYRRWYLRTLGGGNRQ
jgi:dTDP-glucose 4,6-dehydratase